MPTNPQRKGRHNKNKSERDRKVPLPRAGDETLALGSPALTACLDFFKKLFGYPACSLCEHPTVYYELSPCGHEYCKVCLKWKLERSHKDCTACGQRWSGKEISEMWRRVGATGNEVLRKR
jgi:hypothetical protein